MELPLSETEYRSLEKAAKEDGLTVDQEAQLALLYFFKEHDQKLLEEAKKIVAPEVLRVFEKS